MTNKRRGKHRAKGFFCIARASARTWAVAFSRRLIPGAVFRTKAGALRYVAALTEAAGLRHERVMVLGEA
ncbi:MAG TPA: hypothetical protein VLN59_16860 [Burkholderiales bacterium]|nr:hypothetical protein [Burkholderiales bacterium]